MGVKSQEPPLESQFESDLELDQGYQGDEPSVVLLSYAVVEEPAMVVETLDAFITLRAMLRGLEHCSLAKGT